MLGCQRSARSIAASRTSVADTWPPAINAASPIASYVSYSLNPAMIPSTRTSKTFYNTALAGAVLAIERFCRYRRGRGNYAIIANCELVTVVGVGAIMLGEKLTPLNALGGGVIFAGVFYTAGWVSHRGIELPKSFALWLADLSPAHHREVPDGRMASPSILNSQRPLSRPRTVAQPPRREPLFMPP